MTDLTKEIFEAVGGRLGPEGYELVDLVPIRKSRQPGSKFQSLDEAIAAFESGKDEDVVSYLVQLRKPAPKEAAPPLQTPALQETPTRPGPQDPVYLPDGSLNVDFLEKNAEVLLSAGEASLSRNIFKTILSSGGRTAAALNGIGRTYEAEGRMADAISNYEESVAFHPALDTYRRLAAALLADKKEQYAAEVMERALQLRELADSDRMELHRAAGNAWTRIRDVSKAENHYREALKVDAAADDVHCNLASLYLEAGDVNKSRAAFEAAANANAKNDRAWTGLGICHYTQGEKRKAYGFLVRALTVNLQNPTAVFYMLKCAYEIKRYKEAEVLLRNYVESAPVNLSLLYSLAGLQFHLAKYDMAEKTARRILSVRPEHKGASHLIQRVQERTGAAG